MERSRASREGTWLRLSESASWRRWSGYAFEAICLKHVAQIKKSLGISNILTEESVWRYVLGKREPGAQIDLLLDRKDNCINICEMKFSTKEFTITKSYAGEIEQKQKVFEDKTKTRKTIFFTMVTTYGVVKSKYYKALIQSKVKMDALFA